MRVLIVEDEPAYVEALCVALEGEGFESEAVLDGREAIQVFRRGRFDVVLLDLMLPHVTGLDVLRLVRQESDTPVIVVSAKDSEADVVTALELGADDYLTKPYSGRELVARIRAVVRRAGATEVVEAITVGNSALDVERHQLVIEGEAFELPRKEFAVLSLLMERAGRIVTRERILDEVWGVGWGDTKSLDQHIRRLRRKLETNDRAPSIVTIRGVGYRLEAE